MGAGFKHWFRQRYTAAISAFGLLWLFCAVVSGLRSGRSMGDMLSSTPFSVLLTFFTLVALYHGTIGMELIVQDYIECKVARRCSIMVIQCVSSVVAISSVLATLKVIL